MTSQDGALRKSLDSSLQVLIGEKLSSVTFVLDYWQLDFDGHSFNVMSKITVTGAGWAVSSGEPAFRDRLCEQLAKIVVYAEFKDDQGVLVVFEDGSTIHLSGRREDYRGVEAIIFRRRDKGWLIV